MKLNPGGNVEEKKLVRNKRPSRPTHNSIPDVSKKMTSDEYYEMKNRQFEEKHEQVKKDLEKQYSQYTGINSYGEEPDLKSLDSSNEEVLRPVRESMAERYKRIKGRYVVPFRTRESEYSPNGKKNNHGKDNLKTMPDQLKVKSWKDKLRSFFHFQEPHTYVDPWERFENSLEEDEENKNKKREKDIEILMKGFDENKN